MRELTRRAPEARAHFGFGVLLELRGAVVGMDQWETSDACKPPCAANAQGERRDAPRLQNEHGDFAVRRALSDTQQRTNATEVASSRDALVCAIVDSSADAILSETADGLVTSWNKSAERLFGYGAHEIVGRPIEMLCAPERRNEVVELRRAIHRGELVSDLETVWVRKDGRRVDVSISASPIRDAASNLIGVSKIARAIANRRRSERALRQSEQRFSLFMKYLPGAAFIKDADGRVIFVNDAHKEIMGWKGDEWQGKRSAELFPGDVANQFEEHDRRVLESGEALKTIEPIPHRDGYHQYLVSKFPIPTDDASRPMLGGVAIDVTELRRAEEAVRYQKNLLEAVSEASPDGMLVVSSTGQWLSFNKRFLEMWGIPAEVAMYGSDEAALAYVRAKLTDAQAFIDRVELLYQNSEEIAIDEQVLLKDGRIFRRHSFPIRGDAGASGRVWFFHDATHEEQAHEKLRSLAWEATKTEERERRRVAATLHDQVGQLLATMKMKMHTCMHGDVSIKNPILRELEQLTDEVVSVTRTLTVELSPPVLYELGIYQAVRWLGATMLESKAINFTCRFDAEPRIDDESRLIVFQAVRELLLNILKHAQARNVTVHVWEEAGELKVAVEDDGVGFDRSAMEAAARGNSFGLFSLRERLKHLGRALGIESVMGRGTRAMISVPTVAGSTQQEGLSHGHTGSGR